MRSRHGFSVNINAKILFIFVFGNFQFLEFLYSFEKNSKFHSLPLYEIRLPFPAKNGKFMAGNRG